MKLAVVRDVFMNESDIMTFQGIDKRSPVTFVGRREPIASPPPDGILYKYYDNSGVPNLDWYDVVDIAELYHVWGLIILSQRLQNGRKTYVTVWDNIPYNNLVPGITVPILEGATGFIARSEMTASTLALYGIDEKKIHIVHAGVDTRLFTPTERTPHKKPVVGYAGRLTWEKGISDLLHASRGMDWKILLAGPDYGMIKFVEEYKETFKLDIEYVGSVPHKDMPQFMNKLDVFVYPSIPTQKWVEQFGISVIEALACGVPVVTTDVGAFVEMQKLAGEDCYQTVPAMSWDMLRDSIGYSIESGEGEAARNAAVTHWSSEVIGSQLKKVYSGQDN